MLLAHLAIAEAIGTVLHQGLMLLDTEQDWERRATAERHQGTVRGQVSGCAGVP